MGFTRWQWYYNKTQYINNTSHKLVHHTQTKHSTQNYTNNKGHTTMQIQLQLQLSKLILIKNKYAILICVYVVLYR
jgi:hypothetical protein